MKKKRQQRILKIISEKRVGTQQDLADELARAGIAATQSSVSRDIVEMGLTKVKGYYSTPKVELPARGPLVDIDSAGENLIVVKTEVGQAQPIAVAIDQANIDEIIGTVAGDDTILVAVKNLAAQRLAVKKIIKVFAHSKAPLGRGRAS